MKRLAFAVIGLSLLVALVLAGCAAPAGPTPGEELSSCVLCHTDKDMLKQTVTVVEEVKSEATEGEG
ncbi:MAG TPA: hypothetical protein G4O07_00290 [Dehalococcoidia bacterium]|nr:hypothetical protein [Dehalococcoidia bacterium]